MRCSANVEGEHVHGCYVTNMTAGELILDIDYTLGGNFSAPDWRAGATGIFRVVDVCWTTYRHTRCHVIELRDGHVLTHRQER